VLHPLCYILPRRRFIKLNRYIIKATHLHFLLAIYCFERFYLGSKTHSDFLALQRVSSYETLANGFASNQIHKPDILRQNLKPRGYRRESIATQAAQNILDEVFRSSIRMPRHMGNAMYYGAVRSGTIKPRTADWIQGIPSPIIPQKSHLQIPVPSPPPSISVTAASDGQRPDGAMMNAQSHPLTRRRISLASTVIESDEPVSDKEGRNTTKDSIRQPAMDDEDGDDEYDEAIATLEDDIPSDDDSSNRTARQYSFQMDMGRPTKVLSPSRRKSHPRQRSPVRKGRKGRGHDPNSVREIPFRSFPSSANKGEHDTGGQPDENSESREGGEANDKQTILGKLHSLERLIVDMKKMIEEQS
jgi:hypothetical protein